MGDLYVKINFKPSITISVADIAKNGDIDKAINQKLIDKFEAKCSRYGYIKNINMISRSGGIYIKEHFNATLRYDIECNADVCNPAQLSRLMCKIVSSNKMGYLGEILDGDLAVVDVIIPLQTAGISHEIDIENIEIGTTIMIEVRGKRFQLNDKKIIIIGRACADTEQDIQNDVVGNVNYDEGDEEDERDEGIHDEDEGDEREEGDEEDEDEDEDEGDEEDDGTHDADEGDEEDEGDEADEEDEGTGNHHNDEENGSQDKEDKDDGDDDDGTHDDDGDGDGDGDDDDDDYI